MADPIRLNRNQIARFVGNDPDAIRAIEQLFQVAGTLTPADIATLTQLILDNNHATGAADNKAEVALASATAAERLADLVATQPAPQDPRLDRLQDVSAHAPQDEDILQYDAAKNRWAGVENPLRSTNVLLWLEAY
jgi:thymidine phosphorylase